MATKSRASFITLQLEGFDELLKKIENAGVDVNNAVNACMNKSANIQESELKSQMNKKRVSSSLINRMPKPEVKWSGNVCSAKVGYIKGRYDPNNLSDGYKAVFINYGTPRIKPREFIKAAKNKARRQIKQSQQETLNEILEGLK